jgi:phosphoglycolate phosphatase-like HAD superfamily hydrolase
MHANYVPPCMTAPVGIIFDFGGTLAKPRVSWLQAIALGSRHVAEWLSAQSYLDSVDYVAARISMECLQSAERSLKCSREHTYSTSLDRALTGLLDESVKSRILSKLVRVFCEPEEQRWDPVAGAHQLLWKVMTLGIRAGVYSNAPDTHLVRRALTRLGLACYFDPILSSAETSWRKPLPVGLLRIATGWRAKANEILVVGDRSDFDVLGARAAGMPSVLVELGPPAKAHPFARPNYRIPDLVSLSMLLDEIG